MRICERCNNPVFGTDKKTRIGYCKTHQYLRTDLDKRSIVQKAMDKAKKEPKRKSGWFDIKKQEEVLQVEEPKYKTSVQVVKEMDAFWKYAEGVIAKKPYCWECGDYISPNDYRAATAHIFPKKKFESIAANKWNFLVLGARCGCHEKSHRLDLFSQMKVFPTAINRYLKFGDLITEKHKYKELFIKYALPTLFLQNSLVPLTIPPAYSQYFISYSLLTTCVKLLSNIEKAS